MTYFLRKRKKICRINPFINYFLVHFLLYIYIEKTPDRKIRGLSSICPSLKGQDFRVNINWWLCIYPFQPIPGRNPKNIPGIIMIMMITMKIIKNPPPKPKPGLQPKLSVCSIVYCSFQYSFEKLIQRFSSDTCYETSLYIVTLQLTNFSYPPKYSV